MNAGCTGKTVRSLAIPEHIRGVFTTRRYTNPRLAYLTLPYLTEKDFKDTGQRSSLQNALAAEVS